MIQRGLVGELEDFHRQYNERRFNGESPPPKKIKLNNEEGDDLGRAYELGIFQSIGFKEFHEYLILPEEKKKTAKGQKLFKNGEERLKLVSISLNLLCSCYFKSL